MAITSKNNIYHEQNITHYFYHLPRTMWTHCLQLPPVTRDVIHFSPNFVCSSLPTSDGDHFTEWCHISSNNFKGITEAWLDHLDLLLVSRLDFVKSSSPDWRLLQTLTHLIFTDGEVKMIEKYSLVPSIGSYAGEI